MSNPAASPTQFLKKRGGREASREGMVTDRTEGGEEGGRTEEDTEQGERLSRRARTARLWAVSPSKAKRIRGVAARSERKR